MLLRIAPQMFKDDAYGCVTIHNVWEEFTQNARIGRDYPWRKDMKKHVKSISQGDLETDSFIKKFTLVQFQTQTQKNSGTGKTFGLSYVDKRVAATCLDRELELCTAEHDLEDFMSQQFDRRNVSPLELVNDWLKKKLIEWNDDRHTVIAEWIERERPQPKREIRTFEKLTGYQYPV